MSPDPLPVDAMMATLDHRRRFRWEDEHSQHVQLMEEAQKLIELRRRKPQH
jgi:hypothetical protein